MPTRLQWGRRVNATERMTTPGVVKSRSRLQWGRRVNATESTLAAHELESAIIASMGPPRERDGENLDDDKAIDYASGFNGAAA